MSRSGFKIATHSEDDLDTHSENLSPLLSSFAKAVIPQNAVDQARARNIQSGPSLMQQLNSIISNKPRYATVADAVKDMTERTGLNVHLDNIKSAKVNKTAEATNVDDDAYEFGLVDGKEALKKREIGDILTSILHHNHKDTVCQSPLAYTLGYAEGSHFIEQLGEDVLNYEINKVRNWMHKSNDKVASISVNIPESFTKHNFVNSLVEYIKNNIRNNNVHSSSVPQLQNDILAIFVKDGLDPQDVMNDEVCKYLSDCIYDERKMSPGNNENYNLGVGVGKDILMQESDPWVGLMPNK